MTSKIKAHLIVAPIFIGFAALLIYNPTLAFLIFVLGAVCAGMLIFYCIIVDGISDHFNSKKRDAEWKIRQQELNEKWELINRRTPRADE